MILCSSPGVNGGQGLKPSKPVTREEKKDVGKKVVGRKREGR
jgi:hypothetical protein